MDAGHGSTHDWSTDVLADHLTEVRSRAAELAADGVAHLLLEVLAYPADEAVENGRVRCRVTRHLDGSFEVADDGRGTQVRPVAGGGVRRKPVMSTPDLRFFDTEPPVLLPDGRPRRGMSVVAALSHRLVHRNRRVEGSWERVYRAGLPVTDLVDVPPDGTTGTTVRFWPGLPGLDLTPLAGSLVDHRAVLTCWSGLDVELVDLAG